MTALEITPQTLEDVLLSKAPEFARLKNPILRKTVGKIATLAQAAAIGGLDPIALVNELRQVVGMLPLGGLGVAAAADDATASESSPAWFDESRIAVCLDAEVFLGRGEHPLGEVKRQAAALAPGVILALTSTFVPAPLIEALRQEGCACWTRREGPERFVTYFLRASASEK